MVKHERTISVQTSSHHEDVGGCNLCDSRGFTPSDDKILYRGIPIKCASKDEAIDEIKDQLTFKNEYASQGDTADPRTSRGRSNSISMTDIIGRNQSTSASNTHSSTVSCVSDIEGRKKVKRSKKKATQRMRPKSHSPLRTATGAGALTNAGRPLMDLRHILKKHERKTQTQTFYDDPKVEVGFYGSLSAIPFLHPEKEEKKARKGKRATKKKDASSCNAKSFKSPNKKEKNSGPFDQTSGSDYDVASADRHIADDISQLKAGQDGDNLEGLPEFLNEVSPIRKVQYCVATSVGVSSSNAQEQFPRNLVDPIESVLHRDIASSSESFRPNVDGEKFNIGQKKDGNSRASIDIDMQVTNALSRNKHVNFSPKSSDISESVFSSHVTSSEAGPQQSNTVDQNVTTTTDALSVTTLSFTFPDGCVITGNFHPKERVQHLMSELRKDILIDDFVLFQFDLCNAEKVPLDERKKLIELGLAPFGEVFVQWRKPITEPSSPGWYLKGAAS